ncbi:FAD-dependent oxidoreductase [Tundrisphaera sp. TA3]|uniref:FAD-dependent oxidoreductase n=1 Tax=Tundrisphaera sp. TA3 TaxID=3435775 RepID=UPI003EC11609
MRPISTAILLACLAAPASAAAPDTYDVVVYGGTSGAIAAAVQAKAQGKSVIVVSPDKHLGGLTSGGLGWTDSGNKAVIGGLSRAFYRRVKAHYDRPEAWVHQKPAELKQYRADDDAMWTFEPHVAEQAFEAWVAEAGVPVVRPAFLDRAKGVKKEGSRIVSISTTDGKVYAGRMFIDATYEGDLMAAAGVSFTTGREANSQYGETLNGVQKARAVSHQFTNKVDPYVVPGDPKSGLLPLIVAEEPGEDGSADRKLQAYNFRTCMTNVAANRVPFPKPEGYDPLQYELLLRDLVAGSRHVFGKIDPAPNGKTDTNNHGSFSTDNIGMNYDYPEATYERRREIIAQHERYQKGFYYFLCNDPRVPADVREKMNKWGLSKDEFLDNGNWPHQIYVREARRMVGDFVMTELHLRMVEPTRDSIGMGSYNMDSHNVQRYVARDSDGKAYARNEGDIQVSPGGPYPVSYRAIIPKAGEAENLLVPVCLSSSHIAYGSIRMEPVFMVLGQSAATAACLALDGGTTVQAVPYDKLKARLLADGQVLEFARAPLRTIGGAKRGSVSIGDLPGVVVDDNSAALAGDWAKGSVIGPFVAEGYRHDDNKEKGKRVARYQARLPQPGRYEVRMAYSANGNRATNVPVTVHHSGGEARVKVDQREAPTIDDLWVSLGTYGFAAEPAIVEVSNDGTDGHVIIDAVQFLPAK